MLYLTKLTLDTRYKAALHALADTYALHRLVYLGFPDQDEGGPGRPLYRLEPFDPVKRKAPAILVQSSVAPRHPERWQERGYIRVEGPIEVVWQGEAAPPPFPGRKRVEVALCAGQVYRFRLRVNPTVKRRFDQSSKRPGHRRIGLYCEEDQRAWLERKAREGGFEVIEVKAAPQRGGEPVFVQDVAAVDRTFYGRAPDRYNSSCNREPDQLQHLAVTFDGMLRVTEPTTFIQTIEGGIGSAKGFGFGLLSLARAG